MTLCECGCEQPIKVDRRGRPRRFVRGHGRHTFRLKNYVVADVPLSELVAVLSEYPAGIRVGDLVRVLRVVEKTS